jgi:hypothetical protein
MLFAGLASPASAQFITTPGITVNLSLTWQEDPAFPHNDNGVLEPGEHALLLMSESFTGQETRVTISPPIGLYSFGDLKGFGGAGFDLLSDSVDPSGYYNGGITNPPSTSVGPNSNASGTSGYGVRSGFRLGVNAANGQPGPNGFIGIEPGQFPSGEPTNITTLNPITNLERLGWSPASYSPRTVNFSVRPNPQWGNQAVALYLFFDGVTTGGWAYVPLTSVAFGSVDIPIAPAPPGVAFFLAAAATYWRPRRSR